MVFGSAVCPKVNCVPKQKSVNVVISLFIAVLSLLIGANVLRVAAVGDFGALHCQPGEKFDRSTQFQFCTSPPIEATRC